MHASDAAIGRFGVPVQVQSLGFLGKMQLISVISMGPQDVPRPEDVLTLLQAERLNGLVRGDREKLWEAG